MNFGAEELNHQEKIDAFDSTPLFMSSLPKDHESNETLAALQALAYDGTPQGKT